MTQTIPKKILGIDIGAKRGISALFFNDYKNGAVFNNKSKYTTHCKNTDVGAQKSFIRNWIDRLEVDYIIYEGRATGKEEIYDRPSMLTMYDIFEAIVLYCHQRKIAGCRVEPYELIDYRDEKGYLKRLITEEDWIKKRGLKKHDGTPLWKGDLPNTWKEEAKKEGYVWIGEDEGHELDATCLWEIWAEKVFLRGEYPSCCCDKDIRDRFGKIKLCATCWLKEREDLHWKIPDKDIKPDNTKISNSVDAYNRRQKHRNK